MSQGTYVGPIRRVLKRFVSNKHLQVDGTVHHQEERPIYVRQKLRLQQSPESGGSTEILAGHWHFEEEKELYAASKYVPFQKEHYITDPLLLNKSIHNLHFKPFNSQNNIKVNNEAEIQLAPLLCSKLSFDNVTQPPIVSHNNLAERFPEILVQLGAYGRFWFGKFTDMYNKNVDNRDGRYAPYKLANYAIPVGAGNLEIPTVWGIPPRKMTAHQVLKQANQQIDIGYYWANNTCGLITFYYDADKDCYTSKPFDATIPWPLDDDEKDDDGDPIDKFSTTKDIHVPAISTKSLSTDTPFNYFRIDDVLNNAGEVNHEQSKLRGGLNLSEDIEAGGAGAVRHEDLNNRDFSRVPIGIEGYENFYMLIPAFRVLNGNVTESLARPRRAASIEAEFIAQDWFAEEENDLSMVGGNNLANLNGQIPFWALYEDTKYMQDQQSERSRWKYNEIARVIKGTEGHALDHRLALAQADVAANEILRAAAQAAVDGNAAAIAQAQAVIAAHDAAPLAAAQLAVVQNTNATLAQIAIINEGVGNAPNNHTVADIQAASVALTQLAADRPGLDAAVAAIETFAHKQQAVLDLQALTAGLQAAVDGLPTADLANNVVAITNLIDGAALDHTDQPFAVLQFAAAEDLTDEQEYFVQRVLTLACDERLNANVFRPHNYTIQMLWKRSTDQNPDMVSAYKYFMLFIDELNSFKQPLPNNEYFGHRVTADIPDDARQTLLNILKENRQVQIEINKARRFHHLKQYVSPFYDTYAEHTAAGGPAKAATRLIPDTSSIKPFTYRSIKQFLDPLTNAEIGVDEEKVGEEIFDVQDGGLLGQLQFNILSGGQTLQLFLPVRNDFVNTLVNKDEVTIECIEPFFGYSTGSHQLLCQEPLNQEKYGQKWPLTVQDYSYTFNQREWVLNHGYVHDSGCQPVLTAITEPEFTTISEMNSNLQHTKETSSIYELSSTLNTYRKSHLPHTTPTLSLETQFGMFKYLFMYVNIPQVSHSTAYPSTNPVVTSFNYAVRGRKNVFVQKMDRFDIERLSRRNCHIDCNWRELHNKGQGILLHLEDLGLTEEVPYGMRGRVVLDVTLLTTQDPLIETFGGVTTELALAGKREFVVVLIRDNQILKGDWEALEFVKLNQ